MPSNAGSVGVDFSFGYFDQDTQSMVDLGDIQDVVMTPQKHDLKNMPYNGPPKYAYIPDGHKLSFTITRNNADLENLAVLRETNFNAGIGSQAGYFTKTIQNVDGSVSKYIYYGFVFFFTDAGTVSRDKLITQKAEGRASYEEAIS